jgi:Holin of 3TMs, for gene-transfer release
MNWKDIAGVVGNVAPILGTLVGGPAGGAVGAMIASGLGCGNTPDDVKTALATNPDAAVKLAQIEKDRQVDLQQLVVQAEQNRLASDTSAIQAVNQTMQAETRAEHWASWLWRPYMGFVAGTMIFGCYFVLPLVHIPSPVIPSEVWLFLGSVLGVASFFRGKAQADPANPAQVRG